MKKLADWLWLVSVLVFSAIDIWSTYYGYSHNSGGAEASPLPAFLIEKFGVNAMLLVFAPVMSLLVIGVIFYTLRSLLTRRWFGKNGATGFYAASAVAYPVVYGFLALKVYVVLGNLHELGFIQ